MSGKGRGEDSVGAVVVCGAANPLGAEGSKRGGQNS